jgi:hypothetical protein
MGFLRRNLYSCTQKVKEKAFTTLVRPSSLEYASSCWDPHIKEHIEEVEKVQRRGARFVSYNPDLKLSRSRARATVTGR